MNEDFLARRPGLRAGAWVLAAVSTVLLAAACSAADRATPPLPGPSPQIFTMRLAHNHPRLDRGVLTYSELTTMRVRQTASFEVQVIDVGRGPQRTAFTRQVRGRFAAPQDVPTGGVVSVQITCGSGLTCTPGSAPARQAIAGTGRSGTWTWDVAATAPGHPQILLTAIRYRGDSQVVRTQMITAVGLTVRSTPVYAVEAAVDARKGTVVPASAALLAIAGALGAALALRRRRGRGQAAAAARTRPDADPSKAETITWPAIDRSAPTWPAIGRPAPPPARPPKARRTFARSARPGRPRRARPGWLRRARPEAAVTSAVGHAPSRYPALVARPGAGIPGMHEIQRRGSGVTLVLWQTPDESLTCQDPDDAWVSRWTYCVSPGQDGRPQFVLTGERHGCLVGSYPGPE
jgi:hypothetical protein